MAAFPNTFAKELTPLPADLGDWANEARDRLAEKGFVVVAGLTPDLSGEVSRMARQPHIGEFCPKDPTEKRFGDLASTEKWLGKGGGRAVFLLGRTAGQEEFQLAGYGWTGLEASEEIPAGKTTFAVRIGEEGRGSRASNDFSQLIVSGSAALYGAEDVWLETWQSNERAVGAYGKVGFEQQDITKPDTRPTLQAIGSVVNGHEVFMGPDTTMVEDTRLYMLYPNELLPQAA